MTFDIAVIGAGPGGYVAAIKAARSGKKVALIERGNVGGVCLNRGCIPTKAYVASAHAFQCAVNAAEFGVLVPIRPYVSMLKVKERKDRIVETLRAGIEKLVKGNGIDLIRGEAKFTGPNSLKVNDQAIEAKNYIIATGSAWIELPNIKVDGKSIVTSDHALDWDEVPKRLLIVGGGVVGCEFACMMNAFGSKVTIVEAMPSILPPVEPMISRLLTRSMKARGIEILTETMVKEARQKGDEVSVSLSDGKEVIADKVLVAVGRRPSHAGLGLDVAGIKVNEKGFIDCDANFRTQNAAVYAIGDVTGRLMLAHAASHAGQAAVSAICGKPLTKVSLVPSPIFTTPEVAAVGMTEPELKKAGVKYKTGRFPYAANGKALCDGETEGQVIVHAAEDGKILGVHIFGKDATLIIAEAVLAMENGLSAQELGETIHSHPTLSETLAEACLDVLGDAIHKATTRR